MEENITEDVCTRSLGWLQRQDNDAKPWLWKLSSCFSATDQSLPLNPQTNEYMENKTATVELKDTPSIHSASSEQFTAVPLPDLHSLQQMQIQLSPGSKVSCCTHGSDSSSHAPRLHLGGGGSSGGGSSVHSGTMLDSKGSGTITCQIGTGFAYQSASSLKTVSARSGVTGIASDLSRVCLENSVSTCSHFPCCGKLHFQSCHSNVHKLHQFPTHQSCATSGYFSCSEFSSGAAGLLEEHVTQSERTSCVCTNSLHLKVAPSVCLKGSHYCTECLSKPSRESLVEAVKIWPNIPPPNAQAAAPVSLPICNGCGTKGARKEKSLLLASSFGQLPQKYGSPDVAITGQLLENLPPIGVFWDIENCSVPSGRSAVAVVQRIREKFFKGHREAEFICVCDISKENKEVIEELNNCQVTVAHINATAKNAADDKLRQSLRRFADTHAAPATVVLVSSTSDVNFALEISDLRHRHGFHIILVHKNQASEALLHHAHELVRFEEFISDLPPRLPVKKPELCRVKSKTMKGSENCQDQLRVDVASSLNNSMANSVSPVNRKTGTGESILKSNQKKDLPAPRSISNSPVERKEKNDVFQVSYPSAFSMLTASRQLSPILVSQSCWSSRSVSPNISNRSSPLTFNIINHTGNADCLDPYANGVDIQVSNVDYRLSRKELQQTLQESFSKHGKVKTVELSPHTDYQLKALIQMENLQEAISAVNSLHRCKIGSKRIQVSLATGATNKSQALVSAEAISILQDAPACCLPLFKFTEIYEKKFGHKLNVSDLYKLTDIVAVRDQGNGRLVCLLPSSQARQSPLGSSQSHDGSSANCSPIIFEELEYHEPICKQHCMNKDFSEHDFDPDSYKVPFVILSLKIFAPQVHSLLQTHEGTVPLLSFPDCYASEFGNLDMVQEGQGGVPFEHLITCVPGVNIATAQNGIKVVKWIHNKPPPPTTEPWLLRSKSPVGNPQLIQFSREVIDLLKNQPSCIMPVSKFIPTYHHHFAKQCRVSDYGYSKLLELLEAVPHVLQILGIGTKRLLTLTHRAQVKRFTQDLLKLLKSQASKQVIVREFLQAYHWCFSKDWDVTEYGVCELVDLISEIPDTTICLCQQDNEMVICIPKRERTKEEIERTKQFSKEVVDLLRHQPYFRMPFNKFIPSYHHHFGRQCKLAYYGFTKLLELFEAIPDVLQVLECGEEKILTLTDTEQIKALAAQFVKLLRSQKDKCLMMTDVLMEYAKTFGYALRLQDYDVSSVPALMQKLCHVIKIIDTEFGKQLQLINKKSLRTLTAQLLVLLMTLDDATCVSVEELRRQYETTQGSPLNPCEYGFMTFTDLLMSVPYFIEVFIDGEVEYVKLTTLYVFAKKVRSLLHTYHYQQIFLHEFSTAYTKYTGEVLHPKAYGYSNLEELLGAIPPVVWIKGHGHKRIVVLKNDMKTRFNSPSLPVADENTENQFADGSGQAIELARASKSLELNMETPNAPVSNQTEQELLCLTNTSPVDLLCEPLPSCLPSPQLRPDPVILESVDLIQFEEHPPTLSETMILTEEKEETAGASHSKEELSHFLIASDAAQNTSASPHPSSESQLSKELMDSPAKRQHKNRVKLAANFSLAPVTKL
ncbi:meiosis regulator and mRNA stability factor 1 isoform X5 [Sceloporus undulatus]|uniref:meiosis regulator and mRNA stability factor 1 isoform X5 n=1 Tax=Sceloporus undulatus TaxID=8520 RepID=UPI001C4B8B24|nr:meiosis regulator and mRNA stability factor 1 isoform X5 [Sceloporus undulatus]